MMIVAFITFTYSYDYLTKSILSLYYWEQIFNNNYKENHWNDLFIKPQI